MTGVLVEEPAEDPDDAEVHDQYDDLHDRVQDVQLALKKEENKCKKRAWKRKKDRKWTLEKEMDEKSTPKTQ